MVFIIARHGESIWNKENKFTGWTDVELSENGIQEAIQLSEKIKNYNFDYIIASDLKRSQETASYIFNNYSDVDKPICYFAKETTERNYGVITGLNKTDLITKYGDKQVHLWRRSYYDRPPGGENLEDVRLRVGTYFDNNILPLLQENKNVLLISHGNSLRALFVHLKIKNEQNIESFEIDTAVPIMIDINNQDYQYLNDYELVGSQIIDSRGFPTIEVTCFDKKTKKIIGKGSTPSGASCGSNEVTELRDKDPLLFKGKSVFNAIKNIDILNKKLNLNKNVELKKCDSYINHIDDSELKSVLGGNTTTAVSFCIADVCSKTQGIELFEYISNTYKLSNDFSSLPTPFVNIINGGKHGVTDDLKIQEFMIFPNEKYNISKQMQIVCEVYQTLQQNLVKTYGKSAKSIGDEGGFCPPIYNTELALQTIEQAIIDANYIVGEDVFMALDCAASEFYNEETKLYEVEKQLFLTGDELIDYYGNLINKYPALKSIEDGFHETDYSTWIKFTEQYSDKIMIVGDDLFTSNKKLIKTGIEEKMANSLLLKVNQIGTISEAIESASLMFKENKNVIVSHRSGETNHSYIIDIAVGIGAQYVKIGSPCRGERVAKFNRLIEIDQILKYRQTKLIS